MPRMSELDGAEPRQPRYDPAGSTATYDEPRGAGSRDPVFPIAGWDRYTGVRFLGQGAMGRVFLAHDPRLRRDVAIKFVNGDDPDHVQRLIAEARAQARVRHPRVCEVHEVGEVGGRVYIAMRHIAGRPLGALADELTVEQKVMVIRDAAEGVHEAHRAGIIHRDLKPSNIMAERRDDGELATYVMDFGLARSQEGGATLTGTVLGTPRYMAPEQARGLVVDRRADVYSLGATLYHLVTGVPSTPGSTPLEVLHNVVTVEPIAPRAVDPKVPADLEAILLKCLEKDSARRYDSARALAEDLTRFLDGEPVRARAAGAWYRLRKRIVKHRRLAVLAVAALALSIAAVTWGWRRSGEAAARERFARRFTTQVEQIESTARYAALSPRHDLRGDRAGLRARMAALAAEIDRAGELAVGPGHYALGRGHYALGDDAAARVELEQAWRDGFREPRVAYALALALGRLYHHELLAAARLEPRARRLERQREIEVRYRDPVEVYLAASIGVDAPSAAYVVALVAFYSWRSDDALHALDAIGDGLPWFYEAPELRGDILLARALGQRDHGDYPAARRTFDEGRRAYAEAAKIGETVPSVYASLAQLEYAVLRMEIYGTGDVAAPYARAIAAADAALAVLPDDYDARVLRAWIARALAEHHATQGRDAEDLLACAIADARRALELAPARPAARLELVQILTQQGVDRQDRNQDPSEPLGQALAIADGFAPADRDARYHAGRGLIFETWADHEDQVGQDARRHRGEAIAAYTTACGRDPAMFAAWNNLGTNYYARAAQARPADADADLAAGLRALDTASALDPMHVAPQLYRGAIHELRAIHQRDRGLDPMPELELAAAAYRRGMAVSPGLALLPNGLGAVWLDEASEAWNHGRDPGPLFAQAQTEFERSIKLAPDQGYGDDNLGELALARAELARLRGEDAGRYVAPAIASLRRAIEQLPDHPVFWANLGHAHAIAAEQALSHGGDPRPALAAAHAALATALVKKPGDPQAELYLAEIAGLEARHRVATRGAAPDELARAAAGYEQALVRRPDSLDVAIRFAGFCAAWARLVRAAGGDPGPALARGRALADRVLAVRASLEAQLARAALAVIDAERADSPEQRRAAARRALDDLTQASARQPSLAAATRDMLAAARRLAR